MATSSKSTPPKIVLASTSPYRRELLARLQIPFSVDAPEIDEAPKPDEMPAQTACRLAGAKAWVVSQRHPEALVIGSDQVAMLDGNQIGKPGNFENALAQLQAMRGRTVQFHTALCLIDGRNLTNSNLKIQNELATVNVRFRQCSDAELGAYLRIEQPYDCAGSAKAEGLGIALLESIDNDDPTALIGLPLIRLVSLLRNLGYPFFQTPEN